MQTAAFNITTAASATAATGDYVTTWPGHESEDSNAVGVLNIVTLGEMVIALLFMFAWAASVAVFLRKWRHLRIVLPSFHGFRRRTPKNIESVRVIRQNDKSVIYTHYPRQIVSNIEARQKMLTNTQEPSLAISQAGDCSHENTPTSSADNRQPTGARINSDSCVADGCAVAAPSAPSRSSTSLRQQRNTRGGGWWRRHSFDSMRRSVVRQFQLNGRRHHGDKIVDEGTTRATADDCQVRADEYRTDNLSESSDCGNDISARSITSIRCAPIL